MPPPMHIHTRKQLFADRRLVDSSRGVRLTMNPPYQTGEENVIRDTWWERKPGSKIGGYSTIRRENGTFRLWYQFGHQYGPWSKKGPDGKPKPKGDGTIIGGQSVLYAESEDGVHFTKPEFGLHEFYGSTQNNVVIPGYVQGGHVWIDPHAPPECRYRSQGNGQGYIPFYGSPDGIHWRKTHEVRLPSSLTGPKVDGRPESSGVDGRTNIHWDVELGRYVMFTRQSFKAVNHTPKGSGIYRSHRAVRRLESDDLVNWDNETLVLTHDETDLAAHKVDLPDQPPVDYNCASVFRYPDERGHWFMLVTCYWHWYDRTLRESFTTPATISAPTPTISGCWSAPTAKSSSGSATAPRSSASGRKAALTRGCSVKWPTPFRWTMNCGFIIPDATASTARRLLIFSIRPRPNPKTPSPERSCAWTASSRPTPNTPAAN